MITEFVEDNLIGKPYSGIRQKWTNMLTAVNDVHHRGENEKKSLFILCHYY